VDLVFADICTDEEGDEICGDGIRREERLDIRSLPKLKHGERACGV